MQAASHETWSQVDLELGQTHSLKGQLPKAEVACVVADAEAVPTSTAPLPSESDPKTACAFCGLLFSWIPIVGIIAYLVNLDAPRDSTRYKLARSALIVSSILIIFVLLFCIIFWPMRSYSYSYHDQEHHDPYN